MNNYCTNCGKKLKKGDLVCDSCNTPIVDIPTDYNYVSPVTKKIVKYILITLLVIIITFFGYDRLKILYKNMKIKSLESKYVIPYLKNTYGESNYDVNYDTSGKCIISGDCAFDPSLGCDGGTCMPYKYLDENTCTSYYFLANVKGKWITVTVVDNDGELSVVEGKNIYGIKEDDVKEQNPDQVS